MIHEQNIHVVIRKRDRVVVIVLKVREGVSIVPIEPILSREPHEPFSILGDGEDGTLREALLSGEALKPDILLLSETG
jgi:hypothetical protein